VEVGIIGLQASGKTTVFNAVTSSKAQTGGYGGDTNIGTVKVPDERVEALSALFKPKKTTFADMRYLDFPGAGAHFGRGEGIKGEFINTLGRMDELLAVVRVFESEAVPHPDVTVDAWRDIEAINLELAFADLAMLERRIDRLSTEVRSMKAGERGEAQRLLDLLGRIKSGLEAEVPVRSQDLSDEDRRLLEGTQFLTARPLLVVLNLGEDQLGGAAALEEEARRRFPSAETEFAAFSGRLEEELADLTPDEAAEYRESLGVPQESGKDRAINLSYKLLGLISFLTSGEDECRAWTVREGATAPQAAGKIHSDLEKGFIRAEVVRWDELVAAGSYAEAKKRGIVRLEGKQYVVRDGDVLHVLFNV
jgi:GTP-binding protein YchF